MTAWFSQRRLWLAFTGGLGLTLLGGLPLQLTGSLIAAAVLAELPLTRGARGAALLTWLLLQCGLLIGLNVWGLRSAVDPVSFRLAGAALAAPLFLAVLLRSGYLPASGVTVEVPGTRTLFDLSAAAAAVTAFAILAAEVGGRAVGLPFLAAYRHELTQSFQLMVSKWPEAKGAEAQVALQWALRLLPSILLISSTATFHLGAWVFFRWFRKDHPFAQSTLRAFRLPGWVLWMLLVCWAAALSPLVAKTPDAVVHWAANGIAWTAFLFFVQGLGVFAVWLDRLPRFLVLFGLFPLILLSAFLFPQVLAMVAAALAGLGLFDPWFNYRKIGLPPDRSTP